MAEGEDIGRRDDDLLPIKFGPVSNGEFHPLPHSPLVRETIRRTYRLADDTSRRLGISRRRFLTSVTGAANFRTKPTSTHHQRGSSGLLAGSK